jgi:pilus assembly protein CpaB
MALPATDLMSREAIIKRGDIVDILVSYPETLNPVGGTETDAAPQQVTFTAFQRLDITALVVDIVQDQNASQQDNAAAPTREQTAVQAYLVALDPQDALVLKYLKDIGGTFDFVLRAPTSSGQFDLTPVTAKFIKELYGLELLP